MGNNPVLDKLKQAVEAQAKTQAAAKGVKAEIERVKLEEAAQQ